MVPQSAGQGRIPTQHTGSSSWVAGSVAPNKAKWQIWSFSPSYGLCSTWLVVVMGENIDSIFTFQKAFLDNFATSNRITRYESLVIEHSSTPSFHRGLAPDYYVPNHLVPKWKLSSSHSQFTNLYWTPQFQVVAPAPRAASDTLQELYSRPLYSYRVIDLCVTGHYNVWGELRSLTNSMVQKERSNSCGRKNEGKCIRKIQLCFQKVSSNLLYIMLFYRQELKLAMFYTRTLKLLVCRLASKPLCNWFSSFYSIELLFFLWLSSPLQS